MREPWSNFWDLHKYSGPVAMGVVYMNGEFYWTYQSSLIVNIHQHSSTFINKHSCLVITASAPLPTCHSFIIICTLSMTGCRSPSRIFQASYSLVNTWPRAKTSPSGDSSAYMEPHLWCQSKPLCPCDRDPNQDPNSVFVRSSFRHMPCFSTFCCVWNPWKSPPGHGCRASAGPPRSTLKSAMPK